MHLLAKNQVELIEADVARARLTISVLSQELIDHICCEVENEMNNNGKSFDEAYLIIKQQTGIQVLQKIQENTLYLIDKNYAIMKTSMKITGNVSLTLLGLGTVFKIFHWPGANITLVIGFALLCLFFFPAAIYLNYRESNEKGKTLLNLSLLLGGVTLMGGVLFKVMHWPSAGMLMIIGWCLVLFLFLPVLLFSKIKTAETSSEKRIYSLGVFSLIIFELSTMFKIMHWPGAGPLMLLGSVLLIGVFLPQFTYLKFKESKMNTAQFIFLVIIAMQGIVLTSLLALNVSQDILGRFVKDEANSSRIVQYFEKKNKAVLNNSDSLSLERLNKINEISKSADQVQTLINNIKLKLVQQAEKLDEYTALEHVKNPELIQEKDNHEVVNNLLIGHSGKGLARGLKEELDKFRKNACEASSSDPELCKNIETLLDNLPDYTNNDNRSWEERSFGNNLLIGTMALLTTIEKNVRIIESTTIQHIHQQL